MLHTTVATMSPSLGRRRRAAAVVLAVTALIGAGTFGAAGTALAASSGVSAAAALPAISLAWTRTIADGSLRIEKSSPSLATLADGQPAVVVGDRAGKVYAFHVGDGADSAGWGGGVPVGAAVWATPSVSGSGSGAIVYVSAGDAFNPAVGGYVAMNANGTRRWSQPALEQPGGGPAAVSASMAVGNLQGGTDVVAGDLGQYEHAFDGPTGAPLGGFPWFQADSNFSTPALANLSGSTQQIIQGGASNASGIVYGTQYKNGGHLQILSSTGNGGQSQPNGGVVCQNDTDQEVDSSPAVGHFGPGGATAIAFGTGSFRAGASTTNQLLAVDARCNRLWATTLNGLTSSSPALVDALGNGGLQVAEGTVAGNFGTAYLINGATGAVLWSSAPMGAIIGSITSADLTGAGYQDLLVPTISAVEILDGRTGAEVGELPTPGVGFQNSPLVTNDPNGTIGITVAGYATGVSQIFHFEVARSNGATVNEAGAWPMFHHDAQLTGNAGGVIPPSTQVPCKAPAGGPNGYQLVASDGGIFSFGNLPFCGSTGNIILNQPVVGSAETPDGGGYWLVASDGGIFAFGDAGFFGSTGNVHLNKPIVGMASTPNGGGYWLVASDGGIFTFGNAGFFGSTGAIHLNKPIVGMGTDRATGGYWLAASDGGVFAFNAAFHGSAGGSPLNQPIVGMQSLPSGAGYRLVASDGGVFAFAAPFDGSMGGTRLNRAVVGIAGF